MKHFLAFLATFCLWSLAACSDDNSSGVPNKEAHPSHPGRPTGKEQTDGMAAMNRTETGNPDTALQSVVAAANKVVLSDQVSVPARRVDTVVRVKAYGYVTWDIRRNKKVAARTAGRVEKLFVKYQYQYITRGQKILELYSPEINTYAAEYLHHLTTPGDEVLRTKAREKLILLGVTEGQMGQLEHTGQISNTFSVYSRTAGYVLFDPDNSNMPSGIPEGNASMDESAMGAGVGGGVSPSQVSFSGAQAQNQLREGMYVNRGQTLFNVNDFAAAWGVLSFDETIQPLLRRGMTVVVKSELLDLPLRSTISFIEPAFNSARQKFMQVRAYLPNGGRQLRINSLIEGTVDISLDRQLIIPAASVFNLGHRKIVWVKTGTTPSGKNIFTARNIQVSLLDKTLAVVTDGLQPGEEVAADGGYLLDSQSLIEQ